MSTLGLWNLLLALLVNLPVLAETSGENPDLGLGMDPDG